MAMSWGSMNNPITPVIAGVTNLSKNWQAALSLAVVDYIGGIALDALPVEDSTANSVINGIGKGMISVVKLSTWDAAKSM